MPFAVKMHRGTPFVAGFHKNEIILAGLAQVQRVIDCSELSFKVYQLMQAF